MSAKPPILQKKTRDPGMRIQALKCFPKVREMLLEGMPVPEVARFVQTEAGEYQSISEASLVRTLHRFKATIPAGDFLAARLPRKHVEAVEQVKAGLDELAASEDLYALQLARIHKLYAVEQTMPNILFPGLTQEIRTAAELLRDRVALKKAMGLYGESGGEGAGSTVTQLHAEVEILEKVYESPALGKALRDHESVHKVISTLRSVTTLARFQQRVGQAADVPPDP